MITIESYFMGRIEKYPVTPEQIMNAGDLMSRVNWVLGVLGIDVELSSGYRPAEINKASGGAAKSTHLSCEGIDIEDPGGEIGATLFKNQHLLIKAGLYMENPTYTKKVVDGKTFQWVHLQSRETKNRVFIPY